MTPPSGGLSELTGDYLVIFCKRIQRSDELELLGCGALAIKRAVAVIGFASRRRRWLLLVDPEPPLLQLMVSPRFSIWVMDRRRCARRRRRGPAGPFFPRARRPGAKTGLPHGQPPLHHPLGHGVLAGHQTFTRNPLNLKRESPYAHFYH